MDDLIRRQAAIDALKNERSDWNCDYNVPVDHCIDAIYSLPPAQPEPSQVARDIATIIENEQDMRVIERNEQQWIPCNERLPNEGVEVLVSAWTDSIMIAWLEDGEWITDEFSFEENCDVIAWCPLPKPYKKELKNDE